MADYTPTPGGVFGAQQAPLLPELQQALVNPYVTPQQPQTFTDSLNNLHARPTPEYQPDDGARAYEKKTQEIWEQKDRRIHGELVWEGMRRYPQDLEKAYQWAYDRIQESIKPEPVPYFEPKSYKGTI